MKNLKTFINEIYEKELRPDYEIDVNSEIRQKMKSYFVNELDIHSQWIDTPHDIINGRIANIRKFKITGNIENFIKNLYEKYNGDIFPYSFKKIKIENGKNIYIFQCDFYE
jgi:hypothetical protein